MGLAQRAVSGRLWGMSMDTELQKHYALLLGVGSPWEVKTVDLKLGEKQVEIELGWQWGADARCPECGRACSIHDCAPERTWRHLDTMQSIEFAENSPEPTYDDLIRNVYV